MNRVTLESRIVLLLLKTLWVRLCVFGGCITRRRLAFFARFGALDSDDSNFAFFSHEMLLRALGKMGTIGLAH